MRIRLVFSFILVLLVSIASFVFILRQSAAREVNSFMMRGGMVDTATLVDTLEEYYAQRGSWEGVEELIWPGRGRGSGSGSGGMGPGMMGSLGMEGQRLRLADAQLYVVFDSDESGTGQKLNQNETDASVSLKVNGEVVGYLLPEGGTALGPGDQAELLDRLTRAATAAALLGGGLSLLLALLLSYQLLRPIEDLTSAAKKLSQGSLSQRVPVRGGSEIAALGTAFNQMAASLQKAEQTRRDMTADIAHELRNPLAVQRANLEAIQDGVYKPDADTIGSILAQNLLLTRLVEDLRTLALADADQLELNFAQADIVALTGRFIERLRPQAAAREIELTQEISPQPVPQVSVDPARMEQIVGNLLSNALRHTPERGSIQVRVSPAPGGVELTVHDSGQGIPPEALPHIFERFYRTDDSRSREAGGSGLGLAIARQLASAHRGTLTAANHPQGGAVFRLFLPVSRENK